MLAICICQMFICLCSPVHLCFLPRVYFRSIKQEVGAADSIYCGQLSQGSLQNGLQKGRGKALKQLLMSQRDNHSSHTYTGMSVKSERAEKGPLPRLSVHFEYNDFQKKDVEMSKPE